MSKSKKKTKQKIKKHLIALSQIASEESHTHTNDTLSLHHLQRLKNHEQNIARLQQPHDIVNKNQSSDSTADLTQWLTKHGVINEKVEIRASSIEGAGNGVFVVNTNTKSNSTTTTSTTSTATSNATSTTIKKGTTVITVPTKIMISSLMAMQESTLRPLFAASGILQQQPSLQLALFLLHETYKQENGKFYPYISTFPTTFSLPLWWNIKELQKLQGTSALRAVARNVVSFSRYYCHIHTLLNTEYNVNNSKSTSTSTSTSTLPFPSEFFTLNNFKWAMSVVMTRQNPVPFKNKHGQVAGRCLALVPVMDMVNHGAELEHGVFYDDETDTVKVACTIDTKVGEEVRMYYGDRTNQELLVHSGFLAQKNVNDAVTIVVQIAGESDPLHKVRMMVLKNEGIVGTNVGTNVEGLEGRESNKHKDKNTTKKGETKREINGTQVEHVEHVQTISPCGYVATEEQNGSKMTCPVCSSFEASSNSSKINFEFVMKLNNIKQFQTFVEIQLLDKNGIRAMLTRNNETTPGATLASLPLNGCVTSLKDATRADKVKMSMQKYLQCALCRLERYSTTESTLLENKDMMSLPDARRNQEIQLLRTML